MKDGREKKQIKWKRNTSKEETREGRREGGREENESNKH